ncbi:hypothetical protein BDY19DRAFT_904984 [Irpex rosettiformis]|uniref:Uncharacterized protein n=1 Tax=Irpex rosettiformis TaxID=378272 RepID=A0ACB8U963_9APHY|nr:hypothetical protein BDY19DRAFT_904984 [Irpex rosettiformis]
MSPTTSEIEFELPSVRCSYCGLPPAPGREKAMKRCITCMLVTYCSPKCQKAHLECHLAVCHPPSAGDSSRYPLAWGVSFKDVPIHSRSGFESSRCLSSPQTRGWVCPATELIGIPLYIAPVENMEYASKKDLESICHYLMMDPDTGFSLDSWLCDPRHKETHYTAYHNGKHPLTPNTFETIVAFLKMIVETVSGLSPKDGWSPMRSFLTPEAFQLFSIQYWDRQRNASRTGWGELNHALA